MQNGNRDHRLPAGRFFMRWDNRLSALQSTDPTDGIDTNACGNATDTGSADTPAGLFIVGDAGSGSAQSAAAVTSSAAPAPSVVTVAGSALTIDITWDASVSSAPSGFMPAVIAAAQAYETAFNNAITINLDIGFGEIAGSGMGSGALGESESYLQSVSYTQLIAALQSHNNDATTAAVLASLPASQPIGGTLWLTTAQAKALGIASANGSGLDGYIGLGSAYGFTYNDSNGVAGGTYDFNGVFSHEPTFPIYPAELGTLRGG
jgi:hypothetical protein